MRRLAVSTSGVRCLAFAMIVFVAILSLVPRTAGADEYVALVDDVQYATLQAAIDDAEDEAVVTLTADVSLTSPLEIADKNITIDLGGFVLTFDLEEDDAESESYYQTAVLVSGESAVVLCNGTICDARGEGSELAGFVTIQVQNASTLDTADLTVTVSASEESEVANVVLCVGTEDEVDSPEDVPVVTLGENTLLQDAALVEEADEEADEEAEAEAEGADTVVVEVAVESAGVVGVVLMDARFDDTSYELPESYQGTTLVVAGGASIVVTGNAIESDSLYWGTTVVIEDGALVSSLYGYGIYQPSGGTVSVQGGTIIGVYALYEGTAEEDEDAAEATDDAAVDEEDELELEAVEAAEEALDAEAETDVDLASGDTEAATDEADAGEDEADSEPVVSSSLSITGGSFISTGEDAEAVHSENCTEFVVSGEFSTQLDESYVVATSTVEASDSEETPYAIIGAVTATGYEGVYDGEAHAGAVEFSDLVMATYEPSVLYSADGVTYQEEALTYTNAGEYVVYYLATYGEYTEEGSFVVSIAPATLTVSYAGETISYGSSPSLEVLVEGFVAGETAESAAGYVAPTLDATDCAAEGAYELLAEGGEAENYVFEYVAGVLTVTHSLYAVEQVDSTCSSNGVAAHYACEGCSVLFADAEGTTIVTAEELSLATLDHNYDEGAVTTAPTCTETGVFTYTCTECGATIQESIAALGHDYVAEWIWSDDLSSASLSLTCANDSSHYTFIDSVYSTTEVTTAATEEADGVITYTVQATYEGVGYVDTRTATLAYTDEAEDSAEEDDADDDDEEEESLTALSEDEDSQTDEASDDASADADATDSTSADSADDTEDAEEETGDEVLSNSGDDLTSVIVIVIAIAIIAVAVLLIAFVVRRRSAR